MANGYPDPRPIETAIPDGTTHVLVWDSEDQAWATAVIVMEGDDGTIAARHSSDHWPIEATHWMPLPEPPK